MMEAMCVRHIFQKSMGMQVKMEDSMLRDAKKSLEIIQGLQKPCKGHLILSEPGRVEYFLRHMRVLESSFILGSDLKQIVKPEKSLRDKTEEYFQSIGLEPIYESENEEYNET